jgi:hypothetical protein
MTSGSDAHKSHCSKGAISFWMRTGPMKFSLPAAQALPVLMLAVAVPAIALLAMAGRQIIVLGGFGGALPVLRAVAKLFTVRPAFLPCSSCSTVSRDASVVPGRVRHGFHSGGHSLETACRPTCSVGIFPFGAGSAT